MPNQAIEVIRALIPLAVHLVVNAPTFINDVRKIIAALRSIDDPELAPHVEELEAEVETAINGNHQE